MKIAVLGSAFDPPTLGHFDVIKQCLDAFDEVWLVPSYSHAFGKQMSHYMHRTEMTTLFCLDINNQKVKMVDCEADINETKNQPVYSLDLLTYLQKQNPANQYSLIIGPDNLAAFDKFYKSDQLKSQFSPFIAKERLNIRSTKVRDLVNQGFSINELVTGSVANYIHQEKLYKRKITGL